MVAPRVQRLKADMTTILWEADAAIAAGKRDAARSGKRAERAEQQEHAREAARDQKRVDRSIDREKA
jgi:hypothetical protein